MEDLHDGASQPAYHDNVCARLRSLRSRLDQGQSARSHYRFGEWWEVSNRRVIEVFARGCEPRWRPMPSRVDTS